MIFFEKGRKFNIALDSKCHLEKIDYLNYLIKKRLVI